MSSSERAPGSAPGDWFADDRCIDCGACRHVAPGLIVGHQGLSIFVRQPETDEERQMAWLAVEVCPTRSIRTESRQRAPEGLYPHALSAGIHLCGHNARSSYGAHSYFVQRPDGNLLVDSPVFTRKLVQPFEDMGGIAKIILSHRDDVADAAKWADHFGAEVYIHEADRRAAPYATHVIEGAGPAEPTVVGPGLTILPVPGHTEGSVVLLMDDTILFTGDSLCWARDRQTLHAFRNACWYSWPEQKNSLSALADHRFEQVFPGHGVWSPRLDADEMNRHLRALVENM